MRRMEVITTASDFVVESLPAMAARDCCEPRRSADVPRRSGDEPSQQRRSVDVPRRAGDEPPRRLGDEPARRPGDDPARPASEGELRRRRENEIRSLAAGEILPRAQEAAAAAPFPRSRSCSRRLCLDEELLAPGDVNNMANAAAAHTAAAVPGKKTRCGRLLEKVKLILKVEPDDAEDMAILDSEAEKTLQDRIHILEKHFNIKLEDDLSGKMSIFDSNMSTCVLFLSIFVLLLLLTFLTFRLTARVESLELVCSSLAEYIEQINENRTESSFTEERKNPGVIKGKRKSGKGFGQGS